MISKVADLEVVLETADLTVRCVDWGGMTVEHGTIRTDTDPSAAFKGLPDDRCQCPHWGYLLRGQLRYRMGDGTENVINPGDVYYIAPGHTPFLAAGAEYIEFSPADQLAQTLAVVERNLAVLGGLSNGAV
jgi:hypothetical protein